MKKLLCALLVLMFALASAEENVSVVSVAALMGPTGMGMARLMREAEDGGEYSFEISASPDMITPALIKGDVDIACLPANLAAVLYARSGGGLTVAAVNTLGVLYIVERGESIRAAGDLRGRTVYSAGKGSVPEYALAYALQAEGLDMGTDVKMDWKSEHAECVSALLNDPDGVALLPQPFVTAAMSKRDDLRIALDLNDSWLSAGGTLITGVVVARREFAEAQPEKLEGFLDAYEESVNWVNSNTADAALLIGEYGIVPAEVAEKALPYCGIVCIRGEEMMSRLSGYLKVLYDMNPASVGGAVPDEAFYWAP